MGPYMRPIPVGASAAMVFSLLVAFIVTPWASMLLLKQEPTDTNDEHAEEGWSTRLYRRAMTPLIEDSRWRLYFLSGVVGLLLIACALVAFGLVRVKMLPFDNKSEFQVIVDLPESATSQLPLPFSLPSS